MYVNIEYYNQESLYIQTKLCENINMDLGAIDQLSNIY